MAKMTSNEYDEVDRKVLAENGIASWWGAKQRHTSKYHKIMQIEYHLSGKNDFIIGGFFVHIR